MEIDEDRLGKKEGVHDMININRNAAGKLKSTIALKFL
jgi:hypothetical protein